MKIEKARGENIYKIAITETGITFMADTEIFDGWITELKGMQFLVLQEVHAGIAKEVYYVQGLTRDNGRLILNDISLLDKGSDAVKSIKTYREEVKSSMTWKDFLTERCVWIKN